MPLIPTAPPHKRRHPLQGTAAQAAAQQQFLSELWADALGFMGAVLVRRIVGIAHVADMDSIAGGRHACRVCRACWACCMGTWVTQ